VEGWPQSGAEADCSPADFHEPPRLEIVEKNRFYRWQRIHFPDPEWPRTIEFRFDTVGGVVVVAHLQRAVTNNCHAPELGWELGGSAKSFDLRADNASGETISAHLSHSFAEGVEATCLVDGRLAIYHPTAPLKRRGEIAIIPGKGNLWTYRYLRCRPRTRYPCNQCHGSGPR